MEIRRLYPGTPKLYLPAIQFLRRLAQYQDIGLRRMPQNPRLLHLPREQLGSISLMTTYLLLLTKKKGGVLKILINFANSTKHIS